MPKKYRVGWVTENSRIFFGLTKCFYLDKQTYLAVFLCYMETFCSVNLIVPV